MSHAIVRFLGGLVVAVWHFMRDGVVRLFQSVKKRVPRLSEWAVVALGLLIVLAVVAPQQIEVVVYKAALVTLAAVLGYWIDRRLFPGARPHIYLPDDANSLTVPAVLVQLRRAVIVLACILGLTLGL